MIQYDHHLCGCVKNPVLHRTAQKFYRERTLLPVIFCKCYYQVKCAPQLWYVKIQTSWVYMMTCTEWVSRPACEVLFKTTQVVTYTERAPLRVKLYIEW